MARPSIQYNFHRGEGTTFIEILTKNLRPSLLRPGAGRHDTQHIGTHHNDIQHNETA
jgi:hypothetical protein